MNHNGKQNNVYYTYESKMYTRQKQNIATPGDPWHKKKLLNPEWWYIKRENLRPQSAKMPDSSLYLMREKPASC